MTQQTVHFSIEANTIVEHARNLVLSNDWRRGLDLLVEGLEGMTTDLAARILKGEMTLVDTDDGIVDAEQDLDDDEFKFYIETARWQTAGIYRGLLGAFYQPYARIVGFEPQAHEWARAEMRKLDDTFTTADYRALCAKFYMHCPDSDLVFFDVDDHPVLFRRVEGPAFWVQTYADQKEAMAAFRAERSLDAEGAGDSRASQPNSWYFYEPAIREGLVLFDSPSDSYLQAHDQEVLTTVMRKATAVAMAEVAEQALAAPAGASAGGGKSRFFKEQSLLGTLDEAKDDYQETLLRIRIREQALTAGGFLNLLVDDPLKGEYTLEVPYAPFMHWACRDAGRIARMGLPDWPAVCPRDMKMGGDNPIHTDWWLGAGLSLSEAYDRDHPVNEAVWRVAMALADKQGHNCIKLAGSGTVFGRVVFPGPNEAVPAGAIAVVPTAGVDYEIAMLSACKGGGGAVISAVGGKLAHLATVARETECRVLVVDDAMNAFTEGEFVSINLDECIVERHKTLLDKKDSFDA